jgi:phosphoglycolate phosphatase
MSSTEWNKKQVILFDLDGTLTDPGVGITNSVMYALERYGIYVNDRSELYKFIGPPLAQSFERFYGFSEAEAVAAVGAYREYFAEKGIFENEVFEGIEDLLKMLKAQGKKIGLATSKPEIYARQILEHFGLYTYMDFVSGSLLNGERTDKGEVIGWALELLKAQQGEVDREDIVMIGDREHDILGAKKNRISSIGVTFGYGSREELTDAGADVVVSDMEALAKLLAGEPVYKRKITSEGKTREV